MRRGARGAAAVVGLGAALHGAGRLEESAEVLREGARLSPATPSMLENLGAVSAALGRWEEAADAWSAALAQRRSTGATELRSAAEVFVRARRHEEAFSAFAAAAARQPTNWQHHYLSCNLPGPF